MRKSLIIGTLLTMFTGCILLFGLGLIVQRWMFVNSITRPQTLFPLEMKWQTDLGQSTYERPIYENGFVLMPASQGSDNHWYGLESNTGKIVWSQQVDLYNFRRCLTSEYLVLSGPRSLLVFYIQNGEVVWQKSEPALADTATCNAKTVFPSGTPRGSIYAYTLANGQQLWGVTKPRKSFSGLVYNPETNEIIAKDTNLPEDMYIIEAESGLLKHSFKEAAYAPDDRNWRRGSMYVVDKGELFIGGTVQDAQTGTVIHQEKRYKTVLPPTVTTDTMYLSAQFEGIVAFDRSGYIIKWVYQPQPSDPLNPLSPIAILNGVGYIIFSDATLRAFDLGTGQELGYWQPETNDLWAWPICTFPYLNVMCVDSARAGLTTSADTLFVSFGDGKLYAFGK
jgi:outer membrane protein assembly factor BamB